MNRDAAFWFIVVMVLAMFGIAVSNPPTFYPALAFGSCFGFTVACLIELIWGKR